MPSAISVVPIISRKASASMTIVGFFSMKLASGVAASSITVTATTTAMTMIGRCGVMPTAVMMLSTEKTRSSSRIWPMAAPKRSIGRRAGDEILVVVVGIDVVVDFLGRLPDEEETAGDQDHVLPGEAVAEEFEHRRRELDDPGDGAEQGEAHDEGKADADARGPCSRCSGGSLLVRMEMKIRLSMPRTTSITISVISAIHASGLCIRARMLSIRCLPLRLQISVRQVCMGWEAAAKLQIDATARGRDRVCATGREIEAYGQALICAVTVDGDPSGLRRGVGGEEDSDAACDDALDLRHRAADVIGAEQAVLEDADGRQFEELAAAEFGIVDGEPPAGRPAGRDSPLRTETGFIGLAERKPQASVGMRWLTAMHHAHGLDGVFGRYVRGKQDAEIVQGFCHREVGVEGVAGRIR